MQDQGNAGRKARGRAKYPAGSAEVARRANELRAHQAKRIGPAQAARVLRGLGARAEGDLTPEQVVKLSGAKSLKALRDIAAGRGTREDVAALQVPPEAVGDQYCRGQWFAALAAATAEAMKAGLDYRVGGGWRHGGDG